VTDTSSHDAAEVREAVRQRYAAAATKVTQQYASAESALPVLNTSGCCGPNASCSCGTDTKSTITTDLYAIDEIAELPSTAVLASMGCGNPTALAELKPGDTVLDLGSGGGIDVLLSARRVGPTGFAYGLDMTDEMLALAEQNREAGGVQNVRFLKGEIEHIPLPDNSVDVVISNCVINLSSEKPSVLREAFRVLKPGGRFAVSDIVVQGQLAAELRANMNLWAGCIAGALEETTYRELLVQAGFSDIGIEVTRVYKSEDLTSSECCTGSECQTTCADLGDNGRLISAFVRATKPS
jgi:arsenite methyltransferase